ncbi:MAG: sensor histidine kinase, partial [Thermoleophilia bacterium]
LEETPIAQVALAEDRVVEVSDDLAPRIPARYSQFPGIATLTCTPVSAGGRWLGVIFTDRGGGRYDLTDAERDALWTVGKTAALAASVRIATSQQGRARLLQERIDLAREVHEGVIQRLFGVQLVFSSQAELSDEARQRIAAELQAALFDLRRALQRPLGRVAPETHTTLLEEIGRLRREHRDLAIRLTPGSEHVQVPKRLEPLAQSVLAEAVRNAHKHAQPSRVEVTLDRTDGTLTLEVANDGVSGRPKSTGMGLRLAALEALQVGGIVEFGEREPGTWRVRLAVPL